MNETAIDLDSLTLPPGVCPVIADFVHRWHDDLLCTADRERLITPLLPQLLNTHRSPQVEEARRWLCYDWLVRTNLPAWLDRIPAVASQACLLRALPAQTAGTRLHSAAHIDAAHAAVVGHAPCADTCIAASTATDAAAAAAGGLLADADLPAAAAAYAVLAIDNGGDSLAPLDDPTVAALQQSAVDLIQRMIALGDEDQPTPRRTNR